jgi:protein-tyrosine phosphatase
MVPALAVAAPKQRKDPMKDIAVLFVCLGNICRSPLAEAAFRREADEAGLAARVDSAGTGDWHIGDPPDARACAEAMRHGIDISGYRARQVATADFREFTHIVALDEKNLADLRARMPADATASLSLLLDHLDGSAGKSVKDPYFGEAEGFSDTWAEVTLATAALVRQLATNLR